MRHNQTRKMMVYPLRQDDNLPSSENAFRRHAAAYGWKPQISKKTVFAVAAPCLLLLGIPEESASAIYIQ